VKGLSVGKNFIEPFVSVQLLTLATSHPFLVIRTQANHVESPVCSASMDPQEQMPDPSGESVTPHHMPAPLRNTINHSGRSKQPSCSFEGAPYNTTLMSPLQTTTFLLCSTAPIQFHPADGDQYTRHISPYLRRSACLSGMGEHRHLSFSYFHSL